jgi:hypothetical protein
MRKLRTDPRRRANPCGLSPTGQIKPTKEIKREIQRTKVKMPNKSNKCQTRKAATGRTTRLANNAKTWLARLLASSSFFASLLPSFFVSF